MSHPKEIDASDNDSSDDSDVVNSVTSPSLRASAPAFVPSALSPEEGSGRSSTANKGSKGHADVTQVTKALLQQVHWYFSDQNLSGDKFLREEIAKHPEGYVEVSVLATFPRIKAMAGDDTSLLICALKQSDRLQMSADTQWVRCLAPLPPYNPRKDAKRTIFVDRMPKEATVQSIKDLFSRFGKVLHVVPPGAEAGHLLEEKKLAAEKEKEKAKTDGDKKDDKDKNKDKETTKHGPLRSVFIEFEKQGSAKKAVAQITAYNKQVKLKRKKGSKANGDATDTPSLGPQVAPEMSPEMSPQFSPPSGSPLSPLSLPPAVGSTEDHPDASPESSPQLSPASEGPFSASELAELDKLSIKDGTHTAGGEDNKDGSKKDEEKKPRAEKVMDLGESFIGLYVMSRYAYDQKFGLPQSSPALGPQGSPALNPVRKDSKADKHKKPEKLMTRDAMNWRKELTPDQIAEQASRLAAHSSSARRNGTNLASPQPSPSIVSATPPREIPAFMLASPQTPPFRPLSGEASKAVPIGSRTPTQGKRTVNMASQDVRNSPVQSSRRLGSGLSQSVGAERSPNVNVTNSPSQSSRAIVAHDRITSSPIPSKRVLGFSVPNSAERGSPSPSPATGQDGAEGTPKKKRRSRNKKGGSKDTTPQSSPSMGPLKPTDTSFLKRNSLLSPGIPRPAVAQVKYARGPDDTKGFNRGQAPAPSPAFRPRAASDAMRGSGRRAFGSPSMYSHGPSSALMHDLNASKFSLDGPTSPPKS